MSKLFVVCGGGHGRVVLDTLLSIGKTVDGIIDTNLPVGTLLFDIPVVGNDAWLLEQEPSHIHLANGLGLSSHNLDARRHLFNHYIQHGFEFIALQHPSAITGRDVTIAAGSQLLAGSQVQCGVSVGKNVVINTRATIDHDCQIMDHCFIGPGTILCGRVKLHQSVFIGAGAVLLPGVDIEEHAIIGAGAVVTKNVAANTCVYGNPAR